MANQLDTSVQGPAGDTGGGPLVQVTNLTKTYRRGSGSITPVDDITVHVDRGEFLVLLGPSGCGKTTLLRCIAGLETPDSGHIAIRGETVFDSSTKRNTPPERRALGMIFQSYALWPHRSVRENVAYPLRSRKVRKQDIAGRVDRALELVGVSEVADQLPGRLSGGQQQRVSMARALVAETDLILFDEPLSNVDAKVREELRFELLQMQRRLGFTAIYVTHDQAEAMELADRIAVLREGKIAQLDRPRNVYNRPVDPYVATFVGTANEVPGTIEGTGQAAVVTTAFGRCALGREFAFAHGSQVRVFWRPEATQLLARAGATVRGDEPAGLVIPATVTAQRFFGASSELLCEGPDGLHLRTMGAGEYSLDTGTEVLLHVPSAALNVYPADAP